MADPVLRQPIQLLKDKRPTSCFMDQVYDPDVDGPWSNAEDFPRVVPAEGGTVVERGTGNLYYVVSVDPVTYKSTLAPTKIVVEVGTDSELKVISYGNDRYTVYINRDHKPTQLTVSSNFIIFGNELVKYQIVRYDKLGQREVLSTYLDSDENYQGNYIPLLPVAKGSAIKQCTNCHTFSDLQDGDSVRIEIFDVVGVLRMSITAYIQNEVSINDLCSDSDMIVGLDATALQQLPNGDFFIYQKQDVSHLGIIPRVHYHNGQYEDLMVDNKSCFIYGLEGFVPAFPGQRQKLIIKKFLGPKQYANIGETSAGSRYVVCEKWVVVMPNEALDSIKVSVMPIWNPVDNDWYLKYIAYSDKRDKVHDVTNMVKFIKEIDPTLFGTIQNLQIELDLSTLFGASATVPYTQSIFLKLQPKSEYQRYLISDTYDMETVYGVESSERRRPVIHYDATLGKYYIPTSRFRNKNAMLDAFYYCANPPLNVLSELSPPEPTHFTIRGLDNLSTLITTPIPIEQFNKAWMINRQGDPSMLLGSNVIVEFLKNIGDDYQLLYGVPVDIYQCAAGGYVGEPKPIA